jgi:hypothetical protein
MWRRTTWWSAAVGVALGGIATAGSQARAQDEVQPVKLSLQPAPAADESVYALPVPATEDQGINQGGVNLHMTITYLTDYVYRGVDQSQALNPGAEFGEENAANFQFHGTMTFNLGQVPHPFIGVFANVLESDPVSNFQEVRPFFGAEWSIRPFVFAAGSNQYTYPDRGDLDTAEVWGRITLDDAAVFRLDDPILSPYIFAAYDYDRYHGWYVEAGVKHDFVLEDTGITLTALANVAYIYKHDVFEMPEQDQGFQHYEFGLIGRYSLNLLLNIPQRYGRWSLNGYIFYTDGIHDDLNADTELWGGAGVEFTY